MIIVLLTTKEKSLGPNFNQQNWILVFRLLSLSAKFNFTRSLAHVFFSLRKIYMNQIGMSWAISIQKCMSEGIP
jgi:hypothetical protein